MLGGAIETAYTVQVGAAVAATLAVLWIWHHPVSMGLKGAALVTATLLVTPYVLDYDLILLALPIAWLSMEGLRTGFLGWEKTALLIVALLPFVSRGIGSAGIPVAPIVLLLLLGLIVRRVLAWPALHRPDVLPTTSAEAPAPPITLSRLSTAAVTAVEWLPAPGRA
jgi:hypothetical protein